MERRTKDWIFGLQVVSVAFIWVFVLGISTWIIHLLRVSREWHDTPSASLAISLLAIPIFLTGASVLTYVFAGLQRERGRPGAGKTEGEPEEASS